jgi:Fe-S cluster assembly protein SufD
VGTQVKSRAQFARGLSRRAVEELSELKEEPQWMRERRLEAWRRYEELPGPTGQEEEWRRTDLSLLRMDDALPYAASPLQGEPPSQWPRALRSLVPDDRKLAGSLVQHESETVQDALDEGLASRGLIWCSLDRAVREHPELVQRYLLSREVPGPHEKFVALHAALTSGGTFLYVPPDLDVTLPLRSVVATSVPGLAVFPHTLVVAETGSRVTLVEEHFSEDGGERAFSGTLTEIYAAEGASVRYVHIQRWGQHVHNLNFLRSFQERGSSVTSIVVGLGGRISKGHVEAFLEGEEASSQMFGLFLPGGGQHFDYVTLQDHVAPHSVSDLLYKAAVKDRARSLYYGVTRVRKSARQSSAYQESRNLLLNEGAKADATPVLEIEAFDVLRCGHGATVGPVDEEQLFYMMSRGLTEPDAQRMIVEGFLQEVLERIPGDPLPFRVMQAVARKLAA